MPSQSSATTLRKRAGSPARTAENSAQVISSSRNEPQLKTSRSPEDLLAAHPAIKPLPTPTPLSSPSSQTPSSTSVSGASLSLTPSSSASLSPSIANRILHVLLKPLYFLIFALFHIGHEIIVSARTMKTFVQVFFLPHKFPIAPELVRVLRKDLGQDLEKKPQHIAVILNASADPSTASEEEEEEWHAKVAHLVQWSIASGVKCLSIMRSDPIPPQWVEFLQERINDGLADFYKEEKVVPMARVRTLRPVEDSLQVFLDERNKTGTSSETEAQRLRRRQGGHVFNLDVVILSEEDGHDRLAANVRALGEAALQKEIQGQDISMKFLEQQLSVELSEPELLIVFKDDLDLSSYPPWHIRLTEIYHHPDQAIIPQYTMFLQALHRFAKCEQRFGK